MNRIYRVLAAEDSPTQAATLRNHLEGAGYDVTMAADGAEAVALLDGEAFDVVVSDVVMPGVDGYELCRAVKERDPDIPVVLLTSMTDPLDVVNALSAGADNFLRKPYQPDELLHRVRNMLYNKDLRAGGRTQVGLELFFLGRRFMITSDREQILDLLVSTFEDLVSVNAQLRAREEELDRANAEVRRRLDDVELERNRLSAVLASLPEGLAVIDAEGRIVHANETLASLAGVPSSSLLGRQMSEAVIFSDHEGRPLDPTEIGALRRGSTSAVVGTSFDVFLDRSEGTRIPVLTRTAPILDHAGASEGAITVIQDIGDLAGHDPVTGLPGHGLLIDRLHSIDPAEGSALLVVLIDRFERIRDGAGPGATKAIITTLTARVRQALESDPVRRRCSETFAAHLGNGDVAVVVSGLRDEADGLAIGGLLARQLSGPVQVDDVDVAVTVSVSVGMCTNATHPTELMASVAAAARDASAQGGARVTAADPAMRPVALERLRRESELRRAIETGEIIAHYQPQVSLRAGGPVAVEALARWQHPHRGVLGAGEVIPLAIESGLIGTLSWNVLTEACAQVQSWRQELPGAEALMLSANLAPEQLTDAEVVDRLRQVLTETGLSPTALVLEITETSMMDVGGAVDRHLQDIKGLGVQLAIDDFGTGYSSLLQLRHLPVDILKIDRAFVAGMLEESADAAIVSGTIGLARALGLETVAEGVETADQLVQLRMLGCDLGQGYHFARPMPAEELPRWWSTQAAAHPAQGSAVSPLTDVVVTDDDTISYILHELRTPLTVITGFAEMLANAPAGEATGHFAQTVLRNARELESRLALVNEARNAAQGGIRLQPDAVDLGELVHTIVDDLRPQLQDHPVNVHAEEVIAAVDRSRLSQAVTNLLTNAAKFSPPGSPVDVSVTADDHHCVIGVRDRGPGIPEHRRPELFRRFSRLGSKSKGMGIGLYLSRLIVDAHGGHLRYDPAPPPDGGALFTMRLPSGTPPPQPGGLVDRAEPPLTTSSSDTPVRVLCIEDNENIATLIQAVLSRLDGVAARVAPDGLRGVAAALEHRPHLVLLDLNLPDVSGEEVLRRLRADPRTAHARVVIASADVNAARLRELETLGASEIMPKPFDVARLVALIGDIAP